jgi:glycosyltransferase involved in cell wall biosynthesis
LKIFVCIESYLPGTLGGGPVRALINLVDHLHPEHQFFIFTRNHDYLDASEYADLEPNAWHPQASVYYTDGKNLAAQLLEQVQLVQPDWIYLNGALPELTRTYLKLRQKERALQAIPVLLAPHGNLSAAALAYHRVRKQAWLAYAKVRSLYRDVIWHAASERESAQIHAVFGAAAQIREVPMAPRFARSESVPRNGVTTRPGAKRIGTSGRRANVESTGQPTTNNPQPPTLSAPLSSLRPPPSALPPHLNTFPPSHSSKAGSLKSQVSPLKSASTSLRLVYFGRLSPEKNLPFAFELLKEFAQAHPERLVIYDLIGSGSAAYEANLHSLSAKLPSTIQVNFIGQLSPEALQTRLQPSGLSSQVSSLSPPQAPSNLPTFPPSSSSPPPQVSSLIPQVSGLSYHALLMPSLTENFSYTVLESLQAGIPVLISDQTPWRDLEAQGIGGDLPLEDLSAWAAALEQLSGQSSAADAEQAHRALKYAREWGADYSRKAATLFFTQSHEATERSIQ